MDYYQEITNSYIVDSLNLANAIALKIGVDSAIISTEIYDSKDIRKYDMSVIAMQLNNTLRCIEKTLNTDKVE